MRSALPFLILCFSAVACAQTSIGSFPSGVVQLTDGWRYQQGDNPEWANQQLDDSSWQSLPSQPESDSCASACWYRLRVQLPPHHAPLAILLVAQKGVLESYIDGHRAGESRFEPWWQNTEPVEYVLPLPADNASLTLAVRIRPPRVAFDANEAAHFTASIGSPEPVQRAVDLHHAKRLLRFLPSGAINLVIFVSGIGLLLLFANQRASPEYLWLGLYFVLLGSANALMTATVYAFAPGIANDLYADPAIYLFIVAQIEFTFAFIRRRPSRLWRVYEAILLCCPVAAVLCAVGVIHREYFLLESAVTLPAALALPILLFYWHRRGNREARWLIFPSLCPAFGVIASNTPTVGELFGRDLSPYLRPILLWNEAPLFIYDLTDVIFLLAIGIVMFFRFTSLSREQARASGELGAAREIQRQLVPAALPVVPYCVLESAYIPASEVGGDFYQVLPQPDGCLLIVMGDVSGKGLKAAMTGALAIGALRTLAAENLTPAALLTRLNGQVVAAQQSGFITCLCASLAPSGILTLANAGHLHPYRNGEEVELDFGLPLGITSLSDYGQTTVALNSGDRITMMTDGVVEAKSPSGELFGFDRTRAISPQSAAQIAAAAQSFGQEDDITVLTLDFNAGKMLRA
jgi:hypothetical protein